MHSHRFKGRGFCLLTVSVRRYSLRSRGAVRDRPVPVNLPQAKPKRAHPQPQPKPSAAPKRARAAQEVEVVGRYRGVCRYEIGRGAPGSGRGIIVQQDRVLCDANALSKFCDRVLQHGYSGSKGGKGSRVSCPHPFCEAVKAGEITADSRVAVVFSRTPGVKQLRVLAVQQNTEGENAGYAVNFCRPSERSRMCFESGYGSFSLAVLRGVPHEATADEFRFEEVESDGTEHKDYIQLKMEEEEEEDESEE